MTAETTTTLPVDEVLALAKRFFTSADAVHDAWLEMESDAHISFGTFRSNIVVAAAPDPQVEGVTRVRASTLREDEAVGSFLAYLNTFDASAAGSRGEPVG